MGVAIPTPRAVEDSASTWGARGAQGRPRARPPPPPRSPPPRPRAQRAGRGGGAGPGARFSGKECLARRGRPRPRSRVNPPPSPGLIYCGSKAGSFRPPAAARPPRPAASLPPPPGRHRQTLANVRPKLGSVSKGGYACPRNPPPSPQLPGAPSPPPLPLPARPRAPPLRSPPAPPSITQKPVKPVPDSWRRAPLQERKKGKSRREGARGRGKGPRSGAVRRGRAQHRARPPRAALALAGAGKPRALGGRARARRSIIYGRINYSAAPGRGGGGEGGCGDHPARGHRSPAGSGGVRKPGGPVVRKLLRGGLREERGGTYGSGRVGSETSQLGREGVGGRRPGWRELWEAGGVGRAWPVNSFFPSFLHSHVYC